MGGPLLTLTRYRQRIGLDIGFLAWVRLNRQELRHALGCGVEELNVSVPASSRLRYLKTGMDRKGVEAELGYASRLARRQGCRLALGMEDASRAEPEELDFLATLALDLGFDRLRYADTLGIQDPFQAKAAMEDLVRRFPVQWEYHAHNDRGMALANALGAWKGGAGILSSTLGGIGERSGNCATEHLAWLMRQELGAMELGRTRYSHLPGNPARLDALAGWFCRIAGRPRDEWRPVFGQGIHRHVSGTHVAVLLKDPATYEAPGPGSFGFEVWPGPASGSHGIVHAAARLGREIDRTQARRVLGLMVHRFDRQGSLDPRKDFLEALEALD